MNLKDIDITFDFQTDTDEGKDPDSASKTLRSYQQLLWSKPLPNGEMMELGVEKGCLKWKDMWFGSDSITASFLHYRFPLKDYVEQNIPNFSEFKKDYWHRTYTIGGEIIFPMVRWSMNQARGCSVKICDRWDLTLKCIQMYYEGKSSPLDKALANSKKFFDLFVDFRGYVDFFLLQDCVDSNYNVKLWLDTPLFVSNPMPKSLTSYLSWINAELEFVEKRGKRILDYCLINNNENNKENETFLMITTDKTMEQIQSKGVRTDSPMKSTIKDAIKELMDNGTISPIMDGILRLILEDKMNRIEIDQYLSSKSLSYEDIKLEALSTIIQYANMILADDIITEAEISVIGLLKIFLKIQEGDFVRYGQMYHVEGIIKKQLKKINEDRIVDKAEALQMSSLQNVFGLSYDEFQAIVKDYQR